MGRVKEGDEVRLLLKPIGKLKHFFDLGTWLIAIGGAVILLVVINSIRGPQRRW